MSKSKKYLIDTNSLINNPYIMSDKNVVITSLVLREIEKLELRRSDKGLQYGIRVAKRIIEDNLSNEKIEIVDIDNGGTLEGYAEDYVDNKLIKYAVEKDYGIITDDILLKHKAVSMGIEVIKSSETDDEASYKGFVEMLMSRDKIDEFYSDITNNKYGILLNQYLVVKSSPITTHDVLVWTGKWFESIYRADKRTKVISGTSQFKRMVAKDPYQAMAMDSLERNQVTMIRGKAGSGKTMIALNHAWNKVERRGARLVIFFNPSPSKDSQELGFFKGDMISKALQSSLGTMLKSKFGDEYIVQEYIENGYIEIFPFTDLRGWDSSSDRETVVLISESQNLTSELLKMGLQRIDDNTQVIIDGDYHQQVDRDAYLHNNGMKRASEILQGKHLYGEVELQNTYRSELADIVDEM